ncbi:MAG TPA: ESX secretion-associated protein EspG [Pseudonocardiaceae bacterium]
MPGTFNLSVAALDILGSQLGLNLRQFPLKIPALAKSMEETRSIGNAVWRDLYQHGLARNGRLDPDVEAALVALARPQVAVSLMFAAAAGQSVTLARAGGTPRLAVLATQRGDVVLCRLGHLSDLVSMLMSLVPDAPPLPHFRQLSVSREAPQARSRDDDEAGFGGSIMERGVPSNPAGRDKEAARRVLCLPRQRAGTLEVIGDKQATVNVGWVDTRDGRYLTYTQRQSDGAIWDVYRAADNRQLGGHIAATIASVTR